MYSHLRESMSIRPLIQGNIIQENGRKYRTDRWICPDDTHYYVFVCISEPRAEIASSPRMVEEKISAGKMKILTYEFQ